MIKNERQYRITKAQVAKLDQALAKLLLLPVQEQNIHPILLKAERDGMASQLADLRSEVNEYEELKAGRYEIPKSDPFYEFPQVLIKARIAQGLTQKELAARLGFKEQQIQIYESNEYSSASLSRIKEIAEALGVRLAVDSIKPSSRMSLAILISRLKDAGLDRNLIMKRLVPASLSEQIRVEDIIISDNLMYQIASHVGRIFGWSTHDILEKNKTLPEIKVAPVMLKVASNANERRVDAYIVYTHYLVLTLLTAMKSKKQKSVPENPYETRTAILERYGALTLANVLEYLWDLGILVLPLSDTGAFHGAYFRENNRHMMVLKQKTLSSSRWMFDALHEACHSLQKPEQSNLVVVDNDELDKKPLLSEEEISANQYAGAVLLGKSPQMLAERCIEEAKRDLKMLKAAVKKVALEENVPVDSLANYMAFRLSLDGHNWWGSAENLQIAGPNPFSVAKDILLQHVDLSKLVDSDAQLVQRALIE